MVIGGSGSWIRLADATGRSKKIMGSSVARPLQKLHFDIKLEQALKQRSLAIIIQHPELSIRY
jgi:hypothetical protein